MNYVELDCWLPFRKRFAYLDTVEYLADSIFLNEELKVRFLNKEYQKPESDYILIFCEISSKEETKFIKAMERLKANMILLGHDDYYDVIKVFMELINRLNEFKKDIESVEKI